jgi:hypothetical protein
LYSKGVDGRKLKVEASTVGEVKHERKPRLAQHAAPPQTERSDQQKKGGAPKSAAFSG